MDNIPNVGIDNGIENLDTQECPRCKSTIFEQKIQLKILPSVHPLNESGQTAHLPVPVIVCAKCLWNLAEPYDHDVDINGLGAKEAENMLSQLFNGIGIDEKEMAEILTSDDCGTTVDKEKADNTSPETPIEDEPAELDPELDNIVKWKRTDN